ncbi:MAG: helix-turn-helix domain-containing protein [Eubacteriaceae bacterium]
MLSDCMNIYRTTRKHAGFTMEQASELLFIGVRSLADYEAGRTIPGDDVVCKMIEVYGSTKLAYLHLKYSTTVGMKYLPDIMIDDLPLSIVRFQKEYNDVTSVIDDMFQVVSDGKIDDEEVSKWKKVSKEISDIASAAMSLMFVE